MRPVLLWTDLAVLLECVGALLYAWRVARAPHLAATWSQAFKDPAGAAADRVERAGTATVGELHADAEHKSSGDERRSDRCDGAAEARNQRRNRNDGSRRDGDQQQTAEEAIGLAPHDQASPRRREAELSPEEHRAKREAEDEQSRSRRLSIDQNERNKHGERQR